ncbi:hypothetical protein JCM6882_001970 [Rhodosporidiobolus microsporus]
MSAFYADAQAAYASATPFTPFLPTSSLSTFAVFSLTLAFVLSFYFSTLRSSSKSGLPLQEMGVAGVASILGGFALVFAFCAVGVNV